MRVPVLLSDGRVELTSGKIISIGLPVLGFEASPESFTTAEPEKFGKIRLTTCWAENGNVMWTVIRDENYHIAVENGGTVLQLPHGVLTFPNPIRNVVQVSGVVVVCLKLTTIIERVPTVAERANPLTAFDASGNKVWQLEGYYMTASIGYEATQVEAAQPFMIQSIDALSGTITSSDPDR
jgi:hypothetical protein